MQWAGLDTVPELMPHRTRPRPHRILETVLMIYSNFRPMLRKGPSPSARCRSRFWRFRVCPERNWLENGGFLMADD